MQGILDLMAESTTPLRKDAFHMFPFWMILIRQVRDHNLDPQSTLAQTCIIAIFGLGCACKDAHALCHQPVAPGSLQHVQHLPSPCAFTVDSGAVGEGQARRLHQSRAHTAHGIRDL